jgi:hypothetical protein
MLHRVEKFFDVQDVYLPITWSLMLAKGVHLASRDLVALVEIGLFEEGLEIAHEGLRCGWRDIDGLA